MSINPDEECERNRLEGDWAGQGFMGIRDMVKVSVAEVRVEHHVNLAEFRKWLELTGNFTEGGNSTLSSGELQLVCPPPPDQIKAPQIDRLAAPCRESGGVGVRA